MSVTSLLRRGKQLFTDKAQIHGRTPGDRFAFVRLEHSSYRLCRRITVVCRVYGQNFNKDVFAIRHGAKTVRESTASIYGGRLLVREGMDVAFSKRTYGYPESRGLNRRRHIESKTERTVK